MNEMFKCLLLDKKFKAKFMLQEFLYILLILASIFFGIILLDTYSVIANILGLAVLLVGSIFGTFKFYKLFVNKFFRRYVEFSEVGNKDLIKKGIAAYIILYISVLIMYIPLLINVVLAFVLPLELIILIGITLALVVIVGLYTVEVMLIVVLVENQRNDKPGFIAFFNTFFSNIKLFFGFSYKKVMALLAMILLAILVTVVIFAIPLMLTFSSAPLLFLVLLVALYWFEIFAIYWVMLAGLQFILGRIPRILK